jgi:hypothetical protein
VLVCGVIGGARRLGLHVRRVREVEISMPPPDFAGLVNGVKNAVQTAFYDLDRWTDEEMYSSRRFTARLFPEFRTLAEELLYDVRFSCSEPRNYEFLYDICFLDTSKGFNERNGYFTVTSPLRRSVLVLECEWNPREEEIIYDFSKLLLARADLRCLVFYRNSQSLLNSCIARAERAIAQYEQGDIKDRYLLVGLYGRQATFTMLDGNGREISVAEPN